MAQDQVRIRVWISETTSERLDAYMQAYPLERVADVVDTALDEYLKAQGY